MPLDVAQFEDDSGKAEKTVIRIVGTSEIRVAHFVDVNPVFCHRVPKPRLSAGDENGISPMIRSPVLTR